MFLMTRRSALVPYDCFTGNVAQADYVMIALVRIPESKTTPDSYDYVKPSDDHSSYAARIDSTVTRRFGA